MNHRGPWRALDAQEIAEVRRLRATEHVTRCALARKYGVSLRTIDRYLAGDPPPVVIARADRIVRRWAELYALDLRPQEIAALVGMLAAGTHDGSPSVAERLLAA